MILPEFNDAGDLPVAIHRATIDEVIALFGVTTSRRRHLARRLLHIHALARATRYVERFVIFGSFITAKPEPRDVDIVLIMRNDFDVSACEPEVAVLFDHERADAELGASIFWIRPALLLEPLDTFINHWQKKRDGTRRGIIEVQT